MRRRIATAFGATELTKSQDYHESVNNTLNWWLGTLDNSEEDHFQWPEDVPSVVKSFVEHPYEDIQYEDVIVLYTLLLEKFPDEDDYSGNDKISQIIYELESVLEVDSVFSLIP